MSFSFKFQDSSPEKVWKGLKSSKKLVTQLEKEETSFFIPFIVFFIAFVYLNSFYGTLNLYLALFNVLLMSFSFKFQDPSPEKVQKGSKSSKKLVTQLEKEETSFFKYKKRTSSFSFFLSFILLDKVQKDQKQIK